jgi:hypothetical protein
MPRRDVGGRWGVATCAWVAFFAFNVGCVRETWSNCRDAECRLRTAEAAWLANQQGVAADLAGLDPIEQAGVVEVLAHAYPGDRERICAAVGPHTAAGRRCSKIELRPHLYRAADERGDPELRRASSVGRAGYLPRDPGLPAPWDGQLAGHEELVGDCGDDPGCVQTRAWRAANAGNAVHAGLGCARAWPLASAVRAECLFRVAEHLLDEDGAARIFDALATCEHAYPLTGNCVQHVLVLTLPRPPPADRADLASIGLVQELIARLRGRLAADVAADYAALVWSLWTRDSYASATSIDGSYLDVLEPEAAPHVRAAAAWALFRTDPTLATDLDAAVEQLQARLATRRILVSVRQAGRPPATGLRQESPPTLWSEDATEQQASMPAIWCLGAGRRTTVADPLDDLRIAVLEAAARLQPPPGQAFFLNVLGSEHGFEVRWTAARLGAALYGGAVASWSSKESDPRVSAELGR